MKISSILLALCAASAAETITLVPVKDSDVYSFMNSTVGDSQTLNVNASAGLEHSHHCLVPFNVAASTIPAGEVAQAKLRVYSMGIQPGGQGGSFRAGDIAIHRQGKTWGETTLKWTDLDPREKAAVLPVTQADAWTEVDVTGLVIDWMNGTANHGFLLRPEIEGSNSGMNVQFFGREIAAYGPKLLITRGTPPVAAPPVIAISQTEGQIVLEWPVTGSSGWVLQETDDLAALWETSPATPAEENGMWRVVHTPGAAGKRFFRLNKP